jgi:D-alanyl-D-alanine carboxypeptidase
MVDALTRTMELDRWPAALAAVRDAHGKIRTHGLGVVALGSPAKISAKSQFRIGSNTKTFTAAVALQLVAEGSLSLDESVETYLPGVVRHPEVTGGDITIRQLLQHTSGLPDMSGDIGENLLEWQHRYISPRASLDLAFAHPVTNVPGASFHYSNANYILAGLVIEAVTGRPLAEELDRRIIEPLHLDDTYFPQQGEEEIRGRHPHSYIPLGDEPVDYTVFDPSWGYAAGAMVSSTADLTTFFSALSRGGVVPAAELAQMRKTIPADALWEGAEYGLGIISFDLSCGVTAWGHGGDVPGTVSRVAATDDGRAAAVAVTQNPTSPESEARLRAFIDTAICSP